MIAERVKIEGSGKAAGGWIKVNQANITYDHPFNAPYEHALNIDFVDANSAPGARIAVELTADAARALIATIQQVLDRAEIGGFVE
jgi:hypothetical protein